MKSFILIILLFAELCFAFDLSKYGIKPTFTFDSIANRAEQTWTIDSSALEYTISSKRISDSTFILLKTYEGKAIANVISSSQLKDVKEYQIYKKGRFQDSTIYSAYSYFVAGIDTTLPKFPKKMLILIDDSFIDSLSNLIEKLQTKLAENFIATVVLPTPRAEVFNSKAVTVTKNIILKYKQLHPDISSVLLLGRIAVPYSGDIAPDGHPEHRGAWHSDGFYGDLGNNWTDDIVSSKKSSFPRQFNMPLDGKFDQVRYDKIDLAIGRVDFFDMPAFNESEFELLQRYLEKDIEYRNAKPTNRNGIVFDNFKNIYASNATENINNICNFSKVEYGRIRELSRTKSYLLGYINGGGTSTSSDDGLYTEELAKFPLNVTFLSIFGSYNIDFDFQNNLLRAALASKPANIVCYSGTFPQWHLYRMGFGYSIGDALLQVQNNSGQYPSNYDIETRGVHIALLGDPTLDLYPSNDLGIISSSQDNNLLKIKINFKESEAKLIGFKTVILKNNYTNFQEIAEFDSTKRDFTFDLGEIDSNQVLIYPILEYTVPTGKFRKIGGGKLIIAK